MVGKRSSLFIVAALLLLSSACQGGDVVEGVVDHKAVTGVKDDIAHTILVNRPGDGEPWIQVRDEDYVDYFAVASENAVISESLQQAMKMSIQK